MAATFDFVSPMHAIRDLWAATTGVQESLEGAPESPPAQVTAYTTLGPMRVFDKAGGLLGCELRYFSALTYAVEGAEATAEAVLAAAYSDFIFLFHTTGLPRRTLGGTVLSASLDFSIAADPIYSPFAGLEFRVLPVVIVATQQAQVGG